MHDSSQETKTTNQNRKRFTLSEANAMLPLISSIVGDIRDVFEQVTTRRVDLHRLLRNGSRNAGSQYDDEMAESRADLQEEYEKIWQFREELESLGVQLVKPESGQIEIPSVIEGQEVLLCWQYGDEQIKFFRDANSRNSEKQPIDVLEKA